MSKFNEFMLTTINDRIKKCKNIYKDLPKNHGTIIQIHKILLKLDNTIKDNNINLKDKVYILDDLRNKINPKIIFKNRFILQPNREFCDQVLYTVGWAQDYFKGKL